MQRDMLESGANMDKWKRIFYYLMINVLISACTTIAVLLIWDQTHPQAAPLEAGSETAFATPDLLGAGGLPTAELIPTEVITPTATTRPIPIGNVEEYEVESGDTLGLIAEKYDVSVDDIMQVNQITDPDSLSAGMLLYIPVGGIIPTTTPEPTNTPAPTTATTPSGPPQEAQVIINSVIAPGDLTSERVWLTRLGDGDLSLSGWQLKDEDGNVFVFPQLDLYEGGAVNVWSRAGSNTPVDLYWGVGSAVWQSGEEVTLVDAAGKERATYTVP
jgi:hypothetical protein